MDTKLILCTIVFVLWGVNVLDAAVCDVTNEVRHMLIFTTETGEASYILP